MPTLANKCYRQLFRLFVLCLLWINLPLAHASLNKDSIKAVIFDMDGVLRTGSSAIEGANDLIQWLESTNKEAIILTNECRYTASKIRNDLISMGIKFPQKWQIYTAAHSMRDFFQEKLLSKNHKTHLYVIGEHGLHSAMQMIQSPQLHLVEEFPMVVNDKDDFFVIFGSVEQVRLSDLEHASRWINRGAKVLTTCPDVSDPASKGEALIGMPGHMIHMIKLNAPCRPYSVGKPNRFMMDKGVQLIKQQNPKLKDSEILFVGDSMDTDITGAFESGLKTALVLTGNTKMELLKHHFIRPDIVAETLYELKQQLQG